MCATSRPGFTWLYLPACSLSSLTSLRATGSESSQYPRTRTRLYAKAFSVVFLSPFSVYIYRITPSSSSSSSSLIGLIFFFVRYILPLLFLLAYIFLCRVVCAYRILVRELYLRRSNRSRILSRFSYKSFDVNNDGPDISEILIIFSQYALAKRKKTHDRSGKDCKEEDVTDTDQYQVYSHSVQSGAWVIEEERILLRWGRID